MSTSSRYILGILGIAIIVVLVLSWGSSSGTEEPKEKEGDAYLAPGAPISNEIPVDDTPSIEAENTTPEETETSPVKSFSMTSYYDETGTHFSLKEIRVKKGDRVTITVTNTKGVHDFTLTEYNIAKETPLDTPMVIEFTADKEGTFEYFCSKPGHRAKGQFGKLIVEG